MTRKKEQEQFISYITERQTHEGQMAVADFCGNMLSGIITLISFPLIRCSFRIVIILRADIEISAFLTAFLSFGARPQILKAAERLESIMNRQPLQYVLSGNWKNRFLW